MPSAATIAVLSAGASPLLHRVLCAALASRPRPAVVRLIWSGHGPVTSDLPLGVEAVTIDPRTFDHGGTRQLALELCSTELLAFLSDDAEPVADSWLGRLTAPFSDGAVAAVYGRQVPRPDAGIAERIFRTNRYPPRSRLITLQTVAAEGEGALPISDANSAYRVTALQSLGGFPRPCSYGEDLAVALATLRQGWRVHYVAEAEVWHSHHLTIASLFRRGLSAGSLGMKAQEQGMGSGFHRSGLGGTRLVWSMIRTGWAQYGVRGAAAVVFVSMIRALGYIAGRLGWQKA